MHGISTCLCPRGAPSEHSAGRREQRELGSDGPSFAATHPGAGCHDGSRGAFSTAESPLSCRGVHRKTPTSRSARTCGSAPPAAGSHGEYSVFDRVGHHVARPADDAAARGGFDGAQWKFKREGFILSFAGPLTDAYDVEPRKLGQGTYGSVCRAVNKSTKTVRAVKTISKSKVRNVKRFKQEVSIMKSLDHPNIMSVSHMCQSSYGLNQMAPNLRPYLPFCKVTAASIQLCGETTCPSESLKDCGNGVSAR